MSSYKLLSSFLEHNLINLFDYLISDDYKADLRVHLDL